MMNVRSALGLSLLALAIGQPLTSTAVETPGQHQNTPAGADELKFGLPESVGMLRGPLEQLVANMTNYTQPANEDIPPEPGSVTIIGHQGTIVSYFAVGHADLYADVNGTHLPPEQQEVATVDTIYDMASLTKIFTTIAALQQVDSRKLALDATVASYLPAFAVNGKESITIQMLMTHTSGMQADPRPGLYAPEFKNRKQRVEAILSQTPVSTPGTAYLYSDLNYMTLMLVLETVTCQPLDALMANLTNQLGMGDTFFNHGNIEGPANPYYERTAAQEFQIDVQGEGAPKRPQPVRGSVHDENAWALDGVSGHAGLFSTVLDTAKLCQMMLNNGTYNGQRILEASAVDMLFHNFNGEVVDSPARSLGFELDKYATAGPLAGERTASHTGFTGTSMVVERDSGTFAVHFANRVHASREWGVNGEVREMVGYWVARALGREV
ncbi:hypothetical protein AJ79_06627 [Helicocarpus griseus UAMH5409]|uniref:Beta-lactamase-related domain-containing protein n=1 Tax=Helicocarpus griseus UAMH5409 TaxID=1447875 RepID=A0A2B7XBD5_9EURO|nr:hypothetical protein AJ79_06627 [Helicocarpus griseus UAMH5409]